jgi:hypothetical protein
MGNLHITTLREQVYLLSEILERELKVSITGAELSTAFERKRIVGAWNDRRASACARLSWPSSSWTPRTGYHTLEDDVVLLIWRQVQISVQLFASVQNIFRTPGTIDSATISSRERLCQPITSFVRMMILFLVI